MAQTSLKQTTRLYILLAEVAILIAANRIAFAQWTPAFTEKGFWFYTGLLALVLGSRLMTPFYSKPVDAVSYCIPAGIALLFVSHWQEWGVSERYLFAAALCYCSAVTIAAFVAILTKDSRTQSVLRLANSLRILSEKCGNPRVVFAVLVLFAVFVFHRTVPMEMFWIGLAWATTGLGLAESAVRLGEKIKDTWQPGLSAALVGEIVAHQTPGVVLIRQTRPELAPFGSCLVIKEPHGAAKAVLALDYVGRDEGMLLRAIEPAELWDTEKVNQAAKAVPDGAAARINTKDISVPGDLSSSASDYCQALVGLVAADTNIERLYFEVVQEMDLEEGRLIEARIRTDPVLYQIVDGMTKEEVVRQKNTHGYVRAKAHKIGLWDEKEGKFKHAKWLPAMNAPVFLKHVKTYIPRPEAIGHFPKTDYRVGIKSIHELVTHNTAILGILGVGKSMLGIELVERMMAEKIKVICLDLTNQYADELRHFYDRPYELKALDKIEKAAKEYQEQWDDSPDKGGSAPYVTNAIYDDLKEFLNADNPRMLKVYNPSRLTATRQMREPKRATEDGQHWRWQVALWSVTPVEITRIISEAALRILQDEMTDRARACLVYEEAHSLIPEWNSVASEGDRTATSGTARAILQGRKYGLGCLVVTQRTASVTKTILNQCNTVFAMRMFDETGKKFLADYVGQDYSKALSSIPERHAVFFGKASTCENPVLIRLNDRHEFLNAFRKQRPPPDLPKDESSETEAVDGQNQGDDDLPF